MPISPIKILVVDDSAFMRVTLSKRLAVEPGFEVVGTAGNGEEALAKTIGLKPNVITMDMEMPRMNGLEALGRIMAEQPTPVIMVSSLTREGAETTVAALTLGAVDCVAKPSQMQSSPEMMAELAAKIRQAGRARVSRTVSVAGARGPAEPRRKTVRPLLQTDTILAIGSSTGGPKALRQLLNDLPGDLNAAGLIVQHMPAGFTHSLANHLNDVSAWAIKEAAAGDRLLCGQMLLAPGGFHLVAGRRGEVTLTETPPVNNVRPAVDVMMDSLAPVYGRRILGIVLTGMGRDGADGAVAIRRAGGRIIAEAESSCTIYGMPRSVVEAGAADFVAPLPEIPALVCRLLAEGKSR